MAKSKEGQGELLPGHDEDQWAEGGDEAAAADGSGKSFDDQVDEELVGMLSAKEKREAAREKARQAEAEGREPDGDEDDGSDVEPEQPHEAGGEPADDGQDDDAGGGQEAEAKAGKPKKDVVSRNPQVQLSPDDEAFWKNRVAEKQKEFVARELEDEEVKVEYDINKATKKIIDNLALREAESLVGGERASYIEALNRDAQAKQMLDERFGDSWKGLHEDADFVAWINSKPPYMRQVIASNVDMLFDGDSVADVFGQYFAENEIDAGAGKPRTGLAAENGKAKRTVRSTPAPASKRAKREPDVGEFEQLQEAGNEDDILRYMIDRNPKLGGSSAQVN